MKTVRHLEDVFDALRVRDGQGPAEWIDPARTDALIFGTLRLHEERVAAVKLDGRKRFGIAAAAAALVLFGGGASAMFLDGRFGASELSKPPPAEELDARRPVRTHVGSRAPSASPPTEPVEPEREGADQAQPPAREDGHHAPARRGSSETQARTPPEDLLRKASELRRKGDFGAAAGVYEQVVLRHRGTLSAYVALVSLAGMRGGANPSEALRLYDEARSVQPNGALDLEIRIGMARAYRHLGQFQKEAEQLRLVADGYPDSLHGKTARERLDSLARGAE